MHDADRRNDLQTVIDLLPLGKCQKSLAVESIDSMSTDEQNDVLALYEQVISQLPAALEAAKRIRGIDPAVRAVTSSPSDTEQ